jgi:hypothetical protein
MASFIKHFRSFRQIAYINARHSFRAGHTANVHRIGQARSLHARVYLKRGYINFIDLDGNGRLHIIADPYQDHSHYFTVNDHSHSSKPVVATARQIHVKEGRSHDSFPTIKEMELYPDMKQAILAIDPSKCVEISGLAKSSGVSSSAVLMLYRSMWHYSLKRKHHLWLMACDVKAFERLSYLFGDALVRIGDNADYMGSEVVPAMLEVSRSVDALMAESKTVNPLKRRMKRELVKFFMDGLPLKFRQVSRKEAVPSREIIKSLEK